MTQEEKELLLKDLCARLPYRVKVHTSFKPICTIFSKPTIYSTVVIDGAGEEVCNISDIKPYLFPLSSMTEEQKREFDISMDMGYAAAYNAEINCANRMIDFFNKYHFDYRGLIPTGLAIDATGLNIY